VLRRELAKSAPPPPPKTRTAYVGQFTAPDPVYLLQRGDVMQRGDVVTPGPLSQLPGPGAELDLGKSLDESARRLALARWLTGPKNPLTARVIVNRIWQYHFGRGLVATPSDFGNQGSPPTHAQLLDWLASDLMERGWRLKQLHRQIVTSYAYRQASAANPQSMEKDAGNLLVWRMPLRRLEAEALRDAILHASGKLDRSVGRPRFPLFQHRVV